MPQEASHSCFLELFGLVFCSSRRLESIQCTFRQAVYDLALQVMRFSFGVIQG
jgi:uncharacterized protein (UPF0332 family)